MVVVVVVVVEVESGNEIGCGTTLPTRHHPA